MNSKLDDQIYLPLVTLGIGFVSMQQKNILDTRVKIMWEEQIVDPPVHYLNLFNCTMIFSIE